MILFRSKNVVRRGKFETARLYKYTFAASSIKHRRRFLSARVLSRYSLRLYVVDVMGSAAFDAITRNRRRQASSSLLVLIPGRESCTMHIALQHTEQQSLMISVNEPLTFFFPLICLSVSFLYISTI